MSKVKIGIVGSRFQADCIWGAVKAIPEEAELVAVASPTKGHAADFAKRHRIPFYVAIPLSTIDWNLKSGLAIPIEERHESEVLGAWGSHHASRTYVRVANPGSRACNPGFDVTPAELITGIITPNGIYKPRQLWAERSKLGGPN